MGQYNLFNWATAIEKQASIGETLGDLASTVAAGGMGLTMANAVGTPIERAIASAVNHSDSGLAQTLRALDTSFPMTSAIVSALPWALTGLGTYRIAKRGIDSLREEKRKKRELKHYLNL